MIRANGDLAIDVEFNGVSNSRIRTQKGKKMESTIDNDTILTTENMGSTTKYFYAVVAYVQAHSVIGDPHQSLQDWISNDDYSDKPTIASIIKKWDEDDKTYEVSDNEITKEFEAQTPEEAARLYFQSYDWAGQVPNRNARQPRTMSDSTARSCSPASRPICTNRNRSMHGADRRAWCEQFDNQNTER